MRRILTTLLAISSGFALAVACGADSVAEAGAPAPKGGSTPLFREASAQPPAATPAASVPVGSTLAPLIERLNPTVVNISTTTVQKNPHRGMRGPGPHGEGGPDPFEEFFERFYGRPMPDMPREFRGQSLGSGFILNSDGHILTNNHVVENATDIKVRLADNRIFNAKIVGRDPATDVALIQLTSPPRDLPTVVLGDSDAMRQGDFVLALGSPFGLRETATLGIVSAKHRSGVSPGGTYDDFLQTDAAINPGNSGGPLFNLKGEVIGINTAIVSPQIGQGIGFAVPINMAKSILPQLREKGKVTRGYLGVSIQDLSPDLAQAFGLDGSVKGALVQQVMPRSPAAKAGIEPGDVVVALNGKPIETSGDLTRKVALVPPGEKVTLTVQRKKQKKDISFAVAQRPDEEKVARGEQEEAQPEESGKSPKLGVSLQPLTPELKRQLDVQGDQGVLIAEVVPGGPADNAGIQRGDLLLEVNRQAVSKPEQVAAIVNKMKDGEMALLRVRRGDSAIFLAVPVGGRQ